LVFFGVPLTEFAWLVAVIVTGGIATGVLAGLFGVGGGAIIVPMLYEVFRTFGVSDTVRMQLCVGTSLAIIVPTSIRSFLAHRAKGDLPVEILRLWAVPIILGVAAGGGVAAVAPAVVFKLAFVVISAVLAVKLLFANNAWQLGTELPGRTTMIICGFVIGLYSSLIGVGGGALSSLMLTSYGRSIHVAVGVSAGVGILISVAGAVGYVIAGLPHQAQVPPLSVGFVSLLGVVLMAPIAALVAPYGAQLAHRLSKRRLEIAFGLYLVAVATRFVVSLF
jgi:uncharacterized protein